MKPSYFETTTRVRHAEKLAQMLSIHKGYAAIILSAGKYYIETTPGMIRNHETLIAEYEKGEITTTRTGEKDELAFERQQGICYVTENGTAYDYNEFLFIAKGNVQVAEYLFKLCEWQHPETLLQEGLKEGEIIEAYILNSNP